MNNLISEIHSLELENAKENPVIETTLDPQQVISKISEREELPPAYLLFLKNLGDMDKKESVITLKILRLYIYARSQHRGDSKSIKNWLQNGALPSEKFGARLRMSLLYNKLRLFTKLHDEVKKTETEINDLVDRQLVGNKFTKRDETSLQKKEFKISDIEENTSKTLDEILHILDKFETLIAPRSDQ